MRARGNLNNQSPPYFLCQAVQAMDSVFAVHIQNCQGKNAPSEPRNLQLRLLQDQAPHLPKPPNLVDIQHLLSLHPPPGPRRICVGQVLLVFSRPNEPQNQYSLGIQRRKRLPRTSLPQMLRIRTSTPFRVRFLNSNHHLARHWTKPTILRGTHPTLPLVQLHLLLSYPTYSLNLSWSLLLLSTYLPDPL